jgi:hypothetical protein
MQRELYVQRLHRHRNDEALDVFMTTGFVGCATDLSGDVCVMMTTTGSVASVLSSRLMNPSVKTTRSSLSYVRALTSFLIHVMYSLFLTAQPCSLYHRASTLSEGDINPHSEPRAQETLEKVYLHCCPRYTCGPRMATSGGPRRERPPGGSSSGGILEYLLAMILR